jgi:hypothetical protein
MFRRDGFMFLSLTDCKYFLAILARFSLASQMLEKVHLCPTSGNNAAHDISREWPTLHVQPLAVIILESMSISGPKEMLTMTPNIQKGAMMTMNCSRGV